MARSSGPKVGLDIGSTTIKVAELISSRGGVSVRAVGMAPTPPDCMENNIIIDAQLLGQAVKKLLKDSGISSRQSVSSVSGQSALVVRVIEVPRMSDSELNETMKWEVERHVPFAANEVIMDFQSIQRADTPADAQNMEVLLAVAQQDMIDRHVEMLFAAGLQPKAIDVEPLAVARALIGLSEDPFGKKTVAMVNIGANNTDIGIFKDGILSFPRTLPLAGVNFTRAISAQMGIDEEQAEEYKKEYSDALQQGAPQAPVMADAGGFMDFASEAPVAEPARIPFDFSPPEDTGFTDFSSQHVPEETSKLDMGEAHEQEDISHVPANIDNVDPTRAAVANALAPVLQELVSEMRRSLDYFRGRPSGGEIDELLICGGSAKLKNLDKYLSRELGIPVHVANPLERLQVAARNYSREYLDDVAPLLTVAVGLAARDMCDTAPVAAAADGKRGRKK